MGSPERMDSGQIGTWAVQDGPKIVLVRSFFRLVVRDRFFGRLGVVLGSFLGAPGIVLVLFWAPYGARIVVSSSLPCVYGFVVFVVVSSSCSSFRAR